MKPASKPPATATRLRRRAEAAFRKNTGARTPDPGPLTAAAARGLVHELQVHQIELELQNEELRRVEAELEASRARYFDLYNLAPVGYCTVSQSGLIREANQTLATRLGRSPGALVTQPLSRFIHPEDQDLFHLLRQPLRATGQPQTCELRLGPPAGPHCWVQLAATAVPEAAGPPVLRIVLSDLSEHLRAEAAIVRLAAIVEFSDDAIISKDLDGRITSWNAGAEKLFGFTATEMVGASIMGLMPPERQPEMRMILDKIRRGESVRHFETIRHTKDGRRLDVSITASPIKDGRGRIVGVSKIFRDITERKRAEEHQVRLVTAIEHANETFVITDTDGKIIYVNPAFERVSGYTCAEALGQTPRLLKSGRQDAEFYRQMWGTLKRGNSWRGHFSNRRKDGTIYEEESSITPIFNRQGIITSYVAVNRDVTRETQLESQVRHTQKLEAIGTLVGGIAHDFNNLLGVVLGYTQLLQQDTAGNAAAQDEIVEILKAASRATDLVQQILTFSRRRETVREGVRLDEILKEALKFLRATVPAGIEINTHLAADAPGVLADATQIYQVVVNLAANALHALEDGPGRLTVSLEPFLPDDEFCLSHDGLRPSSPYARLTVADTGCGMDAQTLERIYEPFFTTKSVGKGTGLGLAVVHGIVQSHGGIITVESEKGRGTTFRVYFPALEVDEPSSENEPDGEVPGQGQTILVVDDEAALAELLQKVLNRLNYQVVSVRHPNEALDLMRANSPQFDLVITDFTMPVMTGLQLARQLHAIRPNLPIILVSGNSAAWDQATLRAAGICETMEKPVSHVTLARVVEGVLAKA